jgi:hypothetical protein
MWSLLRVVAHGPANSPISVEKYHLGPSELKLLTERDLRLNPMTRMRLMAKRHRLDANSTKPVENWGAARLASFASAAAAPSASPSGPTELGVLPVPIVVPALKKRASELPRIIDDVWARGPPQVGSWRRVLYRRRSGDRARREIAD